MDLQDLWERHRDKIGASLPLPVSFVIYLFCPIFLSVSVGSPLVSALEL